MRIRGPLVLGLTLALARPATAQKAEADAAFQRGRMLMAKGETAAACAELETSMRLEPLHGTLYNLALCHEQLGKIASAWSELKELAENDKNAARAKAAARRAATLQKKLTRMRITVSVPVAGLVIKRNEVDVTALADQEVPVDPGRYTFVATAPGKRPVTLELDLQRPGETVAVAIPELPTDEGMPADTPDAPFTVSPFALPRTLRPLAMPRGVGEVEVRARWSSAVFYEQDAVDAEVAGRVGFGPIEAFGSLAMHTRYPQLMATRPTLIRSGLLGASYVIEPMFTAGATYRQQHPLGGDIEEGSEFRAGFARKHIFTPKVAVIGFGGISFETFKTRGAAERNEFALAGNGTVQLAPVPWLTLEAAANLLLNLSGALRDDTMGLEVAGGATLAIDSRTDAYTYVTFVVAPSEYDYRAYLFGVSRRFP